jgi:hypothetical protein
VCRHEHRRILLQHGRLRPRADVVGCQYNTQCRSDGAQETALAPGFKGGPIRRTTSRSRRNANTATARRRFTRCTFSTTLGRTLMECGLRGANPDSGGRTISASSGRACSARYQATACRHHAQTTPGRALCVLGATRLLFIAMGEIKRQDCTTLVSPHTYMAKLEYPFPLLT